MAFNNANDFRIDTAFLGNTVNIVQNPQTLPANILRSARATEASHRSSTAAYATKCHPTTRERVITDIVDWVVGREGATRRSSPQESILWFSGPAGGGKTCIMRSVVDRCEATGLLAASYFFTIRDSRLTIERPFIATLVHQLTISQLELKKEVFDIIQGYPSVFEESLDVQVDELLVQPLQSTRLRPPSRKIVIAIDGLDECGEEHEREHLLNLLHTLVTKLPHLITVVIASRPEFDLRRVFASSKLSSVTKVLQLQKYDGTEDVWVFLCDEFEEIRRSHPLRMLIPEGWPIENIVQLLVDKSSGYFILPSTAAQYIRKSRRNPVDSLNIIVGLLENTSSDTSNPFAELDALYWHILHPPNTDLALLKRILHCICGLSEVRFTRTVGPVYLDEFLGFLPGTTTTTLCDLHAILSIPDSKDEDLNYDGIEFHHKSLRDYLRDPKRSQDFFQSTYDTQLDLTTAFARYITRWDANPAACTSYVYKDACLLWQAYFDSCISHKLDSAILPDIILNIDPRICAKYKFVGGMHFGDYIWHPRRLHGDICSAQRCVRLCQLISNVNSCRGKCGEFYRAYASSTKEERLEALPRFVLETGLYSSFHPDSRSVFDKGDHGGRLENPPTAAGG